MMDDRFLLMLYGALVGVVLSIVAGYALGLENDQTFAVSAPLGFSVAGGILAQFFYRRAR